MPRSLYTEYPNMSEDNKNGYDFSLLLALAKKKYGLLAKLQALFAVMFFLGIMLLPMFFPNLDFVLFLINCITWLVVCLSIIVCLIVVFTKDYFKTELKTKIEKKDYAYLLGQLRRHISTKRNWFIRTLNGLLLESFIVLFAYYAYKSSFLFGFNNFLAGIFFLLAILTKSFWIKAWRELKEDLEAILEDLDISMEDLIEDVEAWKIKNPKV